MRNIIQYIFYNINNKRNYIIKYINNKHPYKIIYYILMIIFFSLCISIILIIILIIIIIIIYNIYNNNIIILSVFIHLFINIIYYNLIYNPSIVTCYKLTGQQNKIINKKLHGCKSQFNLRDYNYYSANNNAIGSIIFNSTFSDAYKCHLLGDIDINILYKLINRFTKYKLEGNFPLLNAKGEYQILRLPRRNHEEFRRAHLLGNKYNKNLGFNRKNNVKNKSQDVPFSCTWPKNND